MKVFVSYQRTDTFFAAHAIGYALRLAGHDAFVDTGSVGGGEDYPQVIRNFVADANVMLAVIGPHYSFTRLQDPTSVVAFEWRRARFHGCPIVPVLVDDATVPADTDIVPELRWFTKGNAYTLKRASFSGDVTTLVDAIESLSAIPRRAARILWVDDRPSNNETERGLLRPHGIVFDNVVSTREAIDQLKNETYDLVITDLGRQGSSDHADDAGATFLGHKVVRAGPPVIVYAGTWAVRGREQLVALGALEVMANRQHLVDTVLRTLGRSDESAVELGR
jgi:CheY-like chemotaxis protein